MPSTIFTTSISSSTLILYIKKEKAKVEQSIHVGAVGDRVTIEIAEHNVVTSWETF
mgnify:CR=1 FL=1